MNYLSRGLSFVRHWFPEALVVGPEPSPRPKPVAVELTGIVGITPVNDDQIEASVAGCLDAKDPYETRKQDSVVRLPSERFESGATRVEARKSSLGRLAHADPFVWLQLLDDRGVALTHETFLGHGVGMKYQVRARIQVPTVSDDAPPPNTNGRAQKAKRRLASGIYARLVTRTYRNPAGPKYHTEALVLTLLPAGAYLPQASAPATTPALALVPRVGNGHTMPLAVPA